MTPSDHSALGKLLPGTTLRGLISVCSAHPMVLKASLRRGVLEDSPVLVEATCNQVNQDGGYTGMTPAAFRTFVEDIADRVEFPRERLILGGDHLGPNPWRMKSAEEAMAKAEAMVADYVRAGLRKIHLDCSMGCLGEPESLDDATTSQRAARLMRVAEDNAPDPATLSYVIGTEVPPPGGARHEISELAVTEPDDALATYEVHRHAFAALGHQAAFERVVGIVVQPGVEFGNANVLPYQRDRARLLSRTLKQMPGTVFEAHSTDYQTGPALRELVDDGFSILKVGPGLTFALREALYGLDAMLADLGKGQRNIMPALEKAMLADPGNWRSHYPGSPEEQKLQRHFSYSDRIRYYWGTGAVRAAVDQMLAQLGDRPLPETLVSQYLARLYPDVASGRLRSDARSLCLAAIGKALDPYYHAIAA